MANRNKKAGNKNGQAARAETTTQAQVGSDAGTPDSDEHTAGEHQSGSTGNDQAVAPPPPAAASASPSSDGDDGMVEPRDEQDNDGDTIDPFEPDTDAMLGDGPSTFSDDDRYEEALNEDNDESVLVPASQLAAMEQQSNTTPQRAPQDAVAKADGRDEARKSTDTPASAVLDGSQRVERALQVAKQNFNQELDELNISALPDDAETLKRMYAQSHKELLIAEHDAEQTNSAMNSVVRQLRRVEEVERKNRRNSVDSDRVKYQKIESLSCKTLGVDVYAAAITKSGTALSSVQLIHKSGEDVIGMELKDGFALVERPPGVFHLTQQARI